MSNSYRFLSFSLVAGLLLAPFAARADAATAPPPWETSAFAPADGTLKAAAGVLPTADEPIVILFEEGSYSFDEQRRSTHRYRVVYRVLTPGGVDDWGSTGAGWSPWNEEKPEIRARVIDPGGKEHWLDPKTVQDAPAYRPSPDIYSDRRSLSAPLPAVSVGALVEIETVSKETRPFFDKGSTSHFYFGTDVPIRKARLVVEAPISLPVRFVTHLLPALVPTHEKWQARQRWTYESGPLPSREASEPSLPSDMARSPHVAFATGASWNEIAGAYARLVEQQIAVAGVDVIAKEQTRGVTGRDAIAAKLLAWVHANVRYSGIHLGDASLVPWAPQETLRRKYGDCKDQATLLVALLRASGIPAHVALLSTGPGQDVDETLPGMGGFDHAIAYLPGKKPLWIDPTDEFARAGELPVADQGRLALVAAPHSRGLVRIPVATYKDNRLFETRDVFMVEEGAARVVETTLAYGAFEDSHRDYYQHRASKEVKENLETYAKNEYNAKKLITHSHSDPRDLARPFELKLEVGEAKMAWTNDTTAEALLNPSYLLRELPTSLKERAKDEDDEDDQDDSESDGSEAAEAEKKRQSDYALAIPVTYQVTYRVIPPPGFAPRPVPEPKKLELGPVTLDETFALDGQVVVATFRLETPKARLSPAEVERLREALEDDIEEVSIAFDQVGEGHLGAGRVREALAEFRKLAGSHSTEALHHLQIARALLAGGMGEAARAAAEKAISVEPTSVRAYRELGFTRQHDLLGRRLHAGFDYAGAIAAYKKALELDPKDVNTRYQYAYLLTVGKEGVVGSPDAPIAQAVLEYKALRKDNDTDDVREALLLALLAARDWVDLKTTAKALPASPMRNQLLVLAVAMVDGVPLALKQASSLGTLEERTQILRGAAGDLVKLRAYDKALALLQELARGASVTPEVRAQIDVVRKLVRHEETTLPESDPRSVVKKLVKVLFLSDPIKAADLRPLFADALQGELKDGSERTLDAFAAMHTQILKNVRRQDLPAKYILDISLTNGEFSMDGTDALGHRVGMRMPGAAPTFFFVVREHGTYRIRAASTSVSELGAEALRRADAGDLEGARKWLDWASELPASPMQNLFSFLAFQKIWKKDPSAPVSIVRLAAASLIAGGPSPKEAIPLLKNYGKTAPPVLQASARLALVGAYQTMEQHRDVLALLDGMTAEDADPDTLFLARGLALTHLKRGAELKGLCEETLKAHPQHLAAHGLLTRQLEQAGELESARRLHQLAVDGGYATSQVLNNLAWLSLFGDKVEEVALATARQAVQMEQRRSSSSLHTLAALYAAAGSPLEAYQTLLEGMEAGDRDEPAPHEWYVIGRIAEEYELYDVAQRAYQKVTGEDGDATSTQVLAKRRLLRLPGTK
jgi:transglutaminase-like putative cysteine protease/tetratricopeptide (TPR) repeat protein